MSGKEPLTELMELAPMIYLRETKECLALVKHSKYRVLLAAKAAKRWEEQAEYAVRYSFQQISSKSDR